MSLSKKHFEAIAKMLGENTKANNKLIIEFALYFKSINPNFNKDKFIDAINKSRELKKADEVYYDHKFDLKAKQVIDEANIEDLQKENKILKSKVKTYEQDIEADIKDGLHNYSYNNNCYCVKCKQYRAINKIDNKKLNKPIATLEIKN